MHFGPLRASAAVCPGAVVVLLLIYCLICFALFVRVICLSLYSCAMLCVHSSFAVILKGCFAVVVLRMCYCFKCSVALPRGAWVGLQYVIVMIS